MTTPPMVGVPRLVRSRSSDCSRESTRRSSSCGCGRRCPPGAPGEAGQIPVAYNTNGRPGSFNKEVTITFKNAAGETSVEKIYIKGRVTAKGSQDVEPEAREDEPKSDMSKQQERFA